VVEHFGQEFNWHAVRREHNERYLFAVVVVVHGRYYIYIYIFYITLYSTVWVKVGRSGEKETRVYIKHPFENQCQVQRSFANTNFSARLKFPAATVATTTSGTSVLRVGLQESLCTAGERRPGNECEFYLSNFRQMPIAHVLGGIVVWNPSSATHPLPSHPFSIATSFLSLSLPLSLSRTHTHTLFTTPLGFRASKIIFIIVRVQLT